MQVRRTSPSTRFALCALLALPLQSACVQLGGERGESPWVDFKPLVAMEEGPRYHTLEGYDPIWKERVQEGIEASRAYWGSYGPTHVWILGREDGERVSEEDQGAFLEEYCACRTATVERTIEECRPYARERFLDVMERGDAEAYLSYVRETDPPMAELVFINVHNWYFERDPVPDPVLRGIHEYTHVFQSAFPVTPTWMMEGGAVFAEAWLPWRSGRRGIEEVMGYSMEAAQEVLRKGRSIDEMEEIETAPQRIARYHRELAYDAGAWAVAFMIHESETQRVSSLRDEFYPSVRDLGWETALAEYTRRESKQEFYADFAEFMSSPRDEQLALLTRLKD
ncbi:MAG: hypothetical protein MK291_07090 [Planctomycetes bacterium]|nr:hypothetical protein [Planctomycetota bacterium]